VTELLLLGLLGGIVALDGTAAGQFMVSRPLVSATLAGWLLGEPALGLAAGLVMELLFLPVLPVGGARFPEGGPAGVVAGLVAVELPGPGGIAAAAFLGLTWALLGGITIHLLRGLNGRLVPDPAEGSVAPAVLVRAHLACLSLDFIRGTVLTLVGVLVAGSVAGWFAPDWPLGPGWTSGVVVLGAAVPVGAALRLFGPSPRLFVAGLVAGILAALAVA